MATELVHRYQWMLGLSASDKYNLRNALTLVEWEEHSYDINTQANSDTHWEGVEQCLREGASGPA